MQSLTRDEFLEVLGLTGGAFDQLQHAGHVALAFGTPLPATPGRYLDLDLVAMAINLGLMQSLGGRRDISTAIVGGFFHQWASAVGQAEADPNQNFFMAVGGMGWEAAKKGPKLLSVTHGTLDEITDDFRDNEGPRRLFHDQYYGHYPTTPRPCECGWHRPQSSVLLSAG